MILVLLIVSMTIISSELGAQPVERPLFVRSQTLAQFFRYAPNPTNFNSLSPGSADVVGSRTMANYWGRDKRFIVDGQSIDDKVQVRAGLHKNLSGMIELSSRKFSNTPMDVIAVGFHDLFMIPQNQRHLAKENGTRIVAPDYGLEITERDIFVPISEQVGVKFEYYPLIQSWNLALSGQWTYEMAPSSLIKQGAQDWGFQGGALKRAPFGYWFSNLNLMLFDATKDG